MAGVFVAAGRLGGAMGAFLAAGRLGGAMGAFLAAGRLGGAMGTFLGAGCLRGVTGVFLAAVRLRGVAEVFLAAGRFVAAATVFLVGFLGATLRMAWRFVVVRRRGDAGFDVRVVAARVLAGGFGGGLRVEAKRSSIRQGEEGRGAVAQACARTVKVVPCHSRDPPLLFRHEVLSPWEMSLSRGLLFYE